MAKYGEYFDKPEPIPKTVLEQIEQMDDGAFLSLVYRLACEVSHPNKKISLRSAVIRRLLGELKKMIDFDKPIQYWVTDAWYDACILWQDDNYFLMYRIGNKIPPVVVSKNIVRYAQQYWRNKPHEKWINIFKSEESYVAGSEIYSSWREAQEAGDKDKHCYVSSIKVT